MLLLLGAFVAGMLTVLAPCVLPLLPIIIGGSLSGNKLDKKRPLVIAISLAVSLIVFTLLLKATTLLINIPPNAIAYVSGVIIIVVGLLSLFPQLYEKLIIKLGIQSKSQRLLGEGQKKKGLLGPIIIGAALGPVFSSCSPVYAYILATILPANFAQAMVYITAYLLGLSLVLLVIGYLGQKFVSKIKWAANPKGAFQRVIAVVFIVVGLLVFTGYDKQVQTWVSTNTPFDFDGLSAKLIPGATQINKGEVLNVESYKAPELTGLENWVNSEPLTLAGLKGKVVLIDFWTYSCINCIRTQPYLKGWNETYKDTDFEIIGVHAPEFAFERVPANVEAAAKEAGLEYPIALDNNFSTWNAFKNQYWPASYLIDGEGNIRRVHYGEGEYKETEQAIRALLQENGSKIPSEMFVEGAANAPVADNQTPETYLGTSRAGNFVGEPRLLRGQTQTYTAETGLELNRWTLEGEWTIGSETITAGDNAKLLFNVAAKDVYIVASSESPQELGVKINGEPISQTKSAGSDVKDSKVLVKDAKLYRLVSHPSFKAESLLELTVPKGMVLNVFTFGS